MGGALKVATFAGTFARVTMRFVNVDVRSPFGLTGGNERARAFAHFSTLNGARQVRRARPPDGPSAATALSRALDGRDARAVAGALMDLFRVCAREVDAAALLQSVLVGRPVPDPFPVLLSALVVAGQLEAGHAATGPAFSSPGMPLFPLGTAVRAVLSSLPPLTEAQLHAAAGAAPFLTADGWLALVGGAPVPVTAHHGVSFLTCLVRRQWVQEAGAFAATAEGRAVLGLPQEGQEEEVAAQVALHLTEGRRAGLASGWYVPPVECPPTFHARVLFAALLERGRTTAALAVAGAEVGLGVELVKAALAGAGSTGRLNASGAVASAPGDCLRLAVRLLRSLPHVPHRHALPGIWEATVRAGAVGLIWRKEGPPVDLLAGTMGEQEGGARTGVATAAIVSDALTAWARGCADRLGDHGAYEAFVDAAVAYGRAMVALRSRGVERPDVGDHSRALRGTEAAALSAAVGSFCAAVVRLTRVDTRGHAVPPPPRPTVPFLPLPSAVAVVDVTTLHQLQEAVEGSAQLAALGRPPPPSLGLEGTSVLVGLDSEWTPVFGALDSSRVELLQLAVLPVGALGEGGSEEDGPPLFFLQGRPVWPSTGFVALLDLPALLEDGDENGRVRGALEALLTGGSAARKPLVLTYGGRSDLSMLARSYPSLRSVFDHTHVADLQAEAAEGVGAATGGLGGACAYHLGAPLDKTFQLSIWHRRPLLPQQRTYAALDAWVLPHLLAASRRLRFATDLLKGSLVLPPAV
jgi:hypothetical protein